MTPPAAVLAAFGVTGPVRPLPGGKSGTWRAGDVVLKPAEGDAEPRWRAGVLTALAPTPHFRIARPVRARDGAWLAGGWEAADSGLLEPLLAARRRVRTRFQLVHGDLLGNVLFADGLPPAIIDWPAYWRPPAWAAAVAVTDALVWHGAGPAVLDRWSHLRCWGQMLVRALIYRIATWPAARWRVAPHDAYRPVVDLVLRYATTHDAP